MKQIPIFKAEAEVSGLVDNILANSSIAYATQLKHFTPNKEVVSSAMQQYVTDAGIKDNDLYFVNSILVTSNWNLNDDVFGKIPTWGARHTPTHKPTNIGHDHNQVVGHIVSNWAIDAAGNVIPDNSVIDDVPDVFHIATGSVIYTAWKEQVLQDRVEALIQQIEAGNKYVSMECLFSDFGYAVISPEGEFYTLARNESNAFLTKHLRAYGGKGKYNGHTIGRFLGNITFSAHGYVDAPANPESIIFDKDHVFSFAQSSQENPFVDNSGVSSIHKDEHTFVNKQESSDMSDFYKEQNEKLEASVSKLSNELETVREQYSQAGIDKLNTQVTELTSSVETLTKERDELAAAKTELETAKAGLETQVEETTKARDEFKSKVEDAEAAAVKASRISELVEAGATKEVATAKVEAFASLTDEQWNAVAETLKEAYAAFPPKDDDKDKDKDKKKKGKSEGSEVDPSELEDEVDAAAASAEGTDLDNVEPEADALALAAEAAKVDELAEARKELRQAVAHRLGKTVAEESDEDNE